MQKGTEVTSATFSPNVAPAASGNEMVVARVAQGYETNINVRFVPGRDIHLTPEVLGCRPRQGAPRRDAQPVDLPERLVDKLRDANKKFVAWLAKDAANTELFLAQPVQALLEAGVDLDRAEQKALDRSHRAVKESAVIAPGVKIASLATSANPKGKVGENRPGRKDKSSDEDCGCEAKGKE